MWIRAYEAPKPVAPTTATAFWTSLHHFLDSESSQKLMLQPKRTKSVTFSSANRSGGMMDETEAGTVSWPWDLERMQDAVDILSLYIWLPRNLRDGQGSDLNAAFKLLSAGKREIIESAASAAQTRQIWHLSKGINCAKEKLTVQSCSVRGGANGWTILISVCYRCTE